MRKICAGGVRGPRPTDFTVCRAPVVNRCGPFAAPRWSRRHVDQVENPPCDYFCVILCQLLLAVEPVYQKLSNLVAETNTIDASAAPRHLVTIAARTHQAMLARKTVALASSLRAECTSSFSVYISHASAANAISTRMGKSNRKRWY